MEHNWEVAKELVAAGKRERAVLLLKKRKLNEKTLENVTVNSSCHIAVLRRRLL